MNIAIGLPPTYSVFAATGSVIETGLPSHDPIGGIKRP
jgi:hypothetical protein